MREDEAAGPSCAWQLSEGCKQESRATVSGKVCARITPVEVKSIQG